MKSKLYSSGRTPRWLRSVAFAKDLCRCVGDNQGCSGLNSLKLAEATRMQQEPAGSRRSRTPAQILVHPSTVKTETTAVQHIPFGSLANGHSWCHSAHGRSPSVKDLTARFDQNRSDWPERNRQRRHMSQVNRIKGTWLPLPPQLTSDQRAACSTVACAEASTACACSDCCLSNASWGGLQSLKVPEHFSSDIRFFSHLFCK